MVIGDEPREKLYFEHKNLKIYGYVKHDNVLNLLKKVSISVVCSRWEEPFGRTSLEAASRGCAVIISNRGGLPETSNNAIILKNLSSEELYRTIENLILDKKLLQKSQKLNYKNFIFDHKYISNLIDEIRATFVAKKIFYTKKNKSFKIMHITNLNERFDGRLHYNTGRRLNNGFIRNGHNVLTLSDRDIIHNYKSIKDFSGKSTLQNKIIEAFNNFKPDIVILGHADRVLNSTLSKMKDINKDIVFSQWFLDPLSKYGPDHKSNSKRILDKKEFLNATFLTTDPSALTINIPNSYFMPNPADKSFETLNNFNKNCPYDVFFAMSHGVHRGVLKKGKSDNRINFLNKLINKINGINYDFYGFENKDPIWGNEFYKSLINSKMGLNLSRGNPAKYYSSNRIASLVGNGLLTFVDKKTNLDDFFNKNEIIFYNGINDLADKIKFFKKNEKSRITIAKNGKKKYFRLFNEQKITKYIIDKSFGKKSILL